MRPLTEPNTSNMTVFYILLWRESQVTSLCVMKPVEDSDWILAASFNINIFLINSLLM